MVFWMRKHGRTFKKDLEADMARNALKANWWGLLVVVALAVGRETAEAVVFLYGLGAEQDGIANLPIVLVLGIGAAFATFWLLQQGSRILSWRMFFRVSEILLLLLAGALLVSGVERLIGLDVLPQLIDPVWDTSRVLDDSGRLGGLVASFTGYRARPALLPLLALALYWALLWFFLNRSGRPAPTTASAAPSPTAPRAERN
jgi:high-affinity iron transporter